MSKALVLFTNARTWRSLADRVERTRPELAARYRLTAAELERRAQALTTGAR